MSPSVRKLVAVQPKAKANVDPLVRPQHRHDGAGGNHAQLMSKCHDRGREERQPQRERPETEPPGARGRGCGRPLENWQAVDRSQDGYHRNDASSCDSAAHFARTFTDDLRALKGRMRSARSRR